MKTLYIPVKKKLSITQSQLQSLEKKLPKNIAICYSIQFKDLAKNIKKYLSKTKSISLFQQVLGCSKPRISQDTEAILLISEGKFHAIGLSLETGKKVFVYENKKFISIKQEEIKKYQQKKKSSYLRFLYADKIGILVTTKQGQERLERALKLKQKLEKQNPEKKVYIFITNNINPNEFENFPDIECWINTACPRLDMAFINSENNNVINLKEIEEYLK